MNKNIVIATILGIGIGASCQPTIVHASNGISESAERMANALDRIANALEKKKE